MEYLTMRGLTRCNERRLFVMGATKHQHVAAVAIDIVIVGDTNYTVLISVQEESHNLFELTVHNALFEQVESSEGPQRTTTYYW
jgi:hypothetical protein